MQHETECKLNGQTLCYAIRINFEIIDHFKQKKKNSLKKQNLT